MESSIASLVRALDERCTTAEAECAAALEASAMLAKRQKRTKLADVTESKSLGFIGVGTINSAIVTGLLTAGLELAPNDVINLSPRNHKKATALLDRFKGRVQIKASNQAVLDASDVVVVAVLPTQAEAVLKTLNFRMDHRVVSLVAALSTPQLKKAVAPAYLVRVVPLPSAATHASTTVISPADELVAGVFNLVGTTIQVPDAQLSVLWAATALMGPIYALQRATAEWVVAQGVRPEAADAFVGSFFHSVTKDSRKGQFDSLVDKQTAGGLNEQVIAELTTAGVFAHVTSALDKILTRISPSKSG